MSFGKSGLQFFDFYRACGSISVAFCDIMRGMEKYTGENQVYRKDFAGWAKVAEEVERRKRPDFVKTGAVFWCNIGVGVGSELVGKGQEFTRPVLVLAMLDKSSVLVVPTTTKFQTGSHYMPIVLNGHPETLALHQFRVVDTLRLGDFIDEVMEQDIKEARRKLFNLLKKLLYKES